MSSIAHDQGSNIRQATDLLHTKKVRTGVNCSVYILQFWCIADDFKNNTSIDRALDAVSPQHIGNS